MRIQRVSFQSAAVIPGDRSTLLVQRAAPFRSCLTVPRLCLHVILFAAAVVMLLTPDVIAQETPDASATVTRLSLGFTGVGRVGTWLPVSIDAKRLLARTHVVLAIEASDTRGDLCTSIVAETVVDDAGSATMTGSFMVGRQAGELAVLVLDDNKVVLLRHVVETSDSIEPASQQPNAEVDALPRDAVCRRLFLAKHAPPGLLSAGRPAGIDTLLAEAAIESASGNAILDLSVDSVSEFPTRRRDWDAVDVCVLQDDFALNAEQTAAMQSWVATGGHLIVSAGRNQSTLLEHPAGLWVRDLFGIGAEASDPPSTQDLSALQNYVSGSTAIQTNRQPVPYLRITSDQSRTLVTSLLGPMLARRSVGAGIVTLVPVELNSKPMSTWLSLPQFYEQLILERRRDASAEMERNTGRISSSGLSDLSTQLAASVDAIPPSSRWSSWHAMLLMLVYLAIIGPLDYLLVTRLLRRPALTWITFPLLVTVACGLTVLGGADVTAATTVRQVHLLDVTQNPVAISSQFVRSRSWSSLSTLDSRESTLSSTPSAPVASKTLDSVFNWNGRAENVFGGLYRPGGSGLGRQNSRRTDLGVSGFTSLPLIANGSVAFLNEVDGTTVGAFESQLYVPAGGLLEGTFTHHLPSAIDDWILVHGNRAYLPSRNSDAGTAKIEPGVEWSQSPADVRVADLRDILQRVRSVEFNDVQGRTESRATSFVQAEYNTEGRDPLSIIRMISLFDLAGSESYVKLHNDLLRRDQVGRSLQFNTALLIGTMSQPLGSLTLDDAPVTASESQTVVRLFLPVERRQRSTTDEF